MSKEVFIALIQKDVKELSMIASGLNESSFPTPTMVKLAAEKAEQIMLNFRSLEELREEEEFNEKDRELQVRAEERRRKDEEEQRRMAAEKAEQDCRLEEMLRQKAEKAEEERREKERITAEEKARQERDEHERARREEPGKNDKDAKPAVETIFNQHQQSIVEKNIGSVETKAEQMTHEAGASMAEHIAASKVEDIRKALSVSDRFRFQRELFGNNAEKMNATLDKINSCVTSDEAADFLNDNFDWDPEDATVMDFLKVLSRRF